MVYKESESTGAVSTTNLGYVHEGGLSPDVPRKGVSNCRVDNNIQHETVPLKIFGLESLDFK